MFDVILTWTHCVAVIKTRLQSLTRGNTEDTYAGVTDCIRWPNYAFTARARCYVQSPAMSAGAGYVFGLIQCFPVCSPGKSCVTRVHQPSWREPTVEPWLSLLCLASPRWSTSWAWVNLSSASCLKKTNKEHLLSAFPSHNALHQLREDSSHTEWSLWWVRAWPLVQVILNFLCWMCSNHSGGSLCLPSCLWRHKKKSSW